MRSTGMGLRRRLTSPGQARGDNEVRLERQRRALPLWLVITQHVSWLALVACIVTLDPPSGVITIDALWWNVMKLVMVIGSIVAFALEVRQALLHRVPA